MAEPDRRAKKGKEQRNHSGDRTVETFSRPAPGFVGKSFAGIYFPKSLGEPVESRPAGERSDSARTRSGEDSVARLARVSARTGYESSPAWRLRQSHSANSASRECDHHDQHLREDGHAGRGRSDEKVGVELFPSCSQTVPQLRFESANLGTGMAEQSARNALTLEAVRGNLAERGGFEPPVPVLASTTV